MGVKSSRFPSLSICFFKSAVLKARLILSAGAWYHQFHNQCYLLLCSAKTAVLNKAEALLFYGQEPHRGRKSHEHPCVMMAQHPQGGTVQQSQKKRMKMGKYREKEIARSTGNEGILDLGPVKPRWEYCGLGAENMAAAGGPTMPGTSKLSELW